MQETYLLSQLRNTVVFILVVQCVYINIYSLVFLRVLCALTNAIIPETMPTEVVLNDRYMYILPALVCNGITQNLTFLLDGV